jgi:hypothetical protein
MERLRDLPERATPLAVRGGTLYYSNGGLWAVPVKGGKPRHLGNAGDPRLIPPHEALLDAPQEASLFLAAVQRTYPRRLAVGIEGKIHLVELAPPYMRTAPVQLAARRETLRTLHEGRYYWLERDSPPGEVLWSLASSRTDGSDAHRVISLDAHPPLFTWLIAKRQHLYYCAAVPGTSRGRLIRLSPPGFTRTPVTGTYGNPFASVWMDGDYLYFVSREQRENWFDWSPEGLRLRLIPVLHRYRME